jgi:hypothetical protein
MVKVPRIAIRRDEIAGEIMGFSFTPGLTPEVKAHASGKKVSLRYPFNRYGVTTKAR